MVKTIKYLVLSLLLVGLASAQEIRRPTADSNPGVVCSTATVATAAGTNAYDSSGTATSVAYTANGAINSPSTSNGEARTFTTWASPSGSYSSLSLNVNTSCVDDTANAGGGCTVDYSINSGSSWTTLISDSTHGGWTQQTTTVTLSTSQAFSSLQVRGCAFGNGGDSSIPITRGNATVTLFDIWTSGILIPPPAAPTSLSATPAGNGLSVSLTWTDNATNETSYQINKCSGASCTPVSYQTGLAVNLSSFNDTTGVSPGTTYGYQVCAVNSAGTACSSTTTATTPTTPTAPTGISLSFTNTQVTISWADNASTETNYILQRCLGSGCTLADYQTLGANTTTFTDTSINGKTIYTYNVIASNAVGRSAGTGNATVITAAHQPNQSSHISAQ
jgi:hypothetical protein